jgi:tetratricopeptide (TPR) repeat protein
MRYLDREGAEPDPPPESPEDLYLHGVYHANRGDLERALSLFEQGLSRSPEQENLLYASAVALAQSGRTGDAMQRLGRAIGVNPLNRVFALNDPDFESVRDEPEFIDLVEPEESRGV